jgi:hypothetical protein
MSFARSIQGLTLDEAAAKLTKIVGKYEVQDTFGDDHLQSVAAAAVAISEVFGYI